MKQAGLDLHCFQLRVKTFEKVMCTELLLLYILGVVKNIFL